MRRAPCNPRDPAYRYLVLFRDLSVPFRALLLFIVGKHRHATRPCNNRTDELTSQIKAVFFPLSKAVGKENRLSTVSGKTQRQGGGLGWFFVNAGLQLCMLSFWHHNCSHCTAHGRLSLYWKDLGGVSKVWSWYLFWWVNKFCLAAINTGYGWNFNHPDGTPWEFYPEPQQAFPLFNVRAVTVATD